MGVHTSSYIVTDCWVRLDSFDFLLRAILPALKCFKWAELYKKALNLECAPAALRKRAVLLGCKRRLGR